MIIKNFSQLKKALAAGHDFQIVEHFIKPEHTGEIRHVQKMQTNGLYSGIAGQPDHKISQANRGLGYWLSFGKASDWAFADTLYGENTMTICTLAGTMSIVVLD